MFGGKLLVGKEMSFVALNVGGGVSVQGEARQKLLQPLADEVGPQNSPKASSRPTNIYEVLLSLCQAPCQVLGSWVNSTNRCHPPEAPRPMCRGRPVGKTHRASVTGGPRVCVMGLTSSEVPWGQGCNPEAHRGR